jgi:hypothetical protein
VGPITTNLALLAVFVELFGGIVAGCFQLLVFGPFGAPLPVLANVLTGLREELPGYFAFDEMLCAPMLIAPPVEEESQTFIPRVCTDVDVSGLPE